MPANPFEATAQRFTRDRIITESAWDHALIAALVLRLGGRVEIGYNEIEVAMDRYDLTLTDKPGSRALKIIEVKCNNAR